MTAPLAITASRGEDGAAVLTVTGEIDMSNAGVLVDALENTQGHVVVDLTAVEYLDSAGLAVLFTHADRIELVANPDLGPVLSISGLTDLTTVHGLRPDDPGAPGRRVRSRPTKR
jgi:anti-sigma B factor antagonist